MRRGYRVIGYGPVLPSGNASMTVAIAWWRMLLIRVGLLLGRNWS